MSIHSINSLDDAQQLFNTSDEFSYAANTQAYYNAPYGIHDITYAILKPVFASRFWMLYKISRSGKDVFTLSHSYLAKIFNCCTRTAERTMTYLKSKGFLEVFVNIKQNKQHANSYKLKIPFDQLNNLMNGVKRRLPKPQIDYSVEHEVEGVQVGEFPGPIVKPAREIPKQGDTRGLLDLKAKAPAGHLAKMLASIQEKLSTDKPEPPPEKPIEPYYGWGTPDINVDPNKLNNKIYNKSGPKKDQPVDFENKKRKRGPTRQVSQQVKEEIKRFVYGNRDNSNPKALCEEIEHHIATNPQLHEMHALNAAKGLITNNTWRTPWGMKSTKSKYDVEYEK
jgi:hypothetical protein